ncbi:hypothetical protein Tco_1497498 [Tanacetum coccineum]
MMLQGIAKVAIRGDKVCRGVGRHKGEERGGMSCLVVRTGHKKMMNSVGAFFEVWWIGNNGPWECISVLQRQSLMCATLALLVWVGFAPDSPFDLEVFSDSDYVRASLDRKSTTGGCQFLNKRLISWQCKKQTIVANSTTKAECCGSICVVKNPVFHSKTKNIEIRHHFIRDSYEKRLIQVIKIHTDHNVADLLTKAFDVSSTRDKFGNKTGSCKVNAARKKLVQLSIVSTASYT